MHIDTRPGHLLRALAFFVAVAAFATGAQAATPEAFTTERFETLQREGETLLVEIYADWCPVCKVQEQVLNDLNAEGALEQVHWLKLDWDAQRSMAKELGAWRQSTLILFEGEREIDRLVAQTDAEAIAAFIGKSQSGH